MQPDYEKQIGSILAAFDWEGCRQMMLVLKWRWGMDEASPSVAELRGCGERLLRDAIGSTPPESVSVWQTGGFLAMRSCGRLELYFGINMQYRFDFDLESFGYAHLGGYRNWII